MPYYETRPIYPWLYSVKERDVFCYLVVGADRALLYDTAYGIGDLPAAVREITDKPVTVVLGHGHVDHANGAYLFDEAWLHEDDFALCRRHSSEAFRERIADNPPEGAALPRGFDRAAYVKAGTGHLKKLEAGQIFDLGGLHAEVVAMEGHTAGSVGLLVKEHRVLLTSDASNPHVWMFLEESLPLPRYIAMLERVMQLDFDTFFIGHGDQPMPKSMFQKFIRVARNASPEKAAPYPAFPSDPSMKGLFYQEDGVGIAFSEAKL